MSLYPDPVCSDCKQLDTCPIVRKYRVMERELERTQLELMEVMNRIGYLRHIELGAS
jgi:hypothetical protein